MTRQMDLSDDDRQFLNEMVSVLGLTKTRLAILANVRQPWLSDVLNGRRRAVDGEMLESVAKQIAIALKGRTPNAQFSEDRTRVALIFLTRFTSAAIAMLPRKIYRPGGPVPVDAGHYVERFADGETLQALQEPPFTMLVSGPVQCGKSSLLARLERKAQDLGFETARFDLRLPITPVLQKAKNQLDINATAAAAVSKLLQAQWGLEPPRDGLMDSIPRLVNWLSKALATTASKPRLLILDDLARLGARAVEDWISLFIRAMHNYRATFSIQLSMAVGLKHHFSQYFRRRLLDLSSVVHWWPKIELGWLNDIEVTNLYNAVTGASCKVGDDDIKDLYYCLSGQPYLTHAAAGDRYFRESVQRWTADPLSKANSESLRLTEPYIRHRNATKLAILGPTLEVERETYDLLQAFIKACSGTAIANPDHKLFLEKAKLLKEDGNPALGIYSLFAKDEDFTSKDIKEVAEDSAR